VDKWAQAGTSYRYVHPRFWYGATTPTRSKIGISMGRGRSWSAQALADVAAAYVEVSTNPVTGVEQKGAVFHKAVYAAFVRRDPDPSTPDGGYVARTQTGDREVQDNLSGLLKVWEGTPAGPRKQAHRCSRRRSAVDGNRRPSWN
jgi:hypothetical protein